MQIRSSKKATWKLWRVVHSSATAVSFWRKEDPSHVSRAAVVT